MLDEYIVQVGRVMATTNQSANYCVRPMNRNVNIRRKMECRGKDMHLLKPVLARRSIMQRLTEIRTSAVDWTILIVIVRP
jgi:hypothetical protein